MILILALACSSPLQTLHEPSHSKADRARRNKASHSLIESLRDYAYYLKTYLWIYTETKPAKSSADWKPFLGRMHAETAQRRHAAPTKMHNTSKSRTPRELRQTCKKEKRGE